MQTGTQRIPKIRLEAAREAAFVVLGGGDGPGLAYKATAT